MGLKNILTTRRSDFVRSIFLIIATLLYAAGMIIVGNSLLDLQIAIQESFAVTSKVLVSRSFGYFTGAFLGKKSTLETISHLFSLAGVHNNYNQYKAMFLFLLGSGLLLITFPLLPNFYLMAGCAFVLGFCMAIVDLGNTLGKAG